MKEINLLRPKSIAVQLGRRYERLLIVHLPEYKILNLYVCGYGAGDTKNDSHYTLKKSQVVEYYKEN